MLPVLVGDGIGVFCLVSYLGILGVIRHATTLGNELFAEIWDGIDEGKITFVGMSCYMLVVGSWCLELLG